MKKSQKALIILIFIGFQYLAINSGQAYETERMTHLNFEQNAENHDLIGKMGTIDTYDNYAHPKIDTNLFDHDLTKVSLNKIQKFDLNATEIERHENMNRTLSKINRTIEEYEISNDFTSNIYLNVNYSFPYRNFSNNALTPNSVSCTGSGLHNPYNLTDYDNYNLSTDTTADTEIYMSYFPTGQYNNEYFDYLWFRGYIGQTWDQNVVIRAMEADDTTKYTIGTVQTNQYLNEKIEIPDGIPEIDIIIFDLQYSYSITDFSFDFCTLLNDTEDHYDNFNTNIINGTQLDNITYSVNAIEHREERIQMEWNSVTYSKNETKVKFVVNSGNFEYFDSDYDMKINTQQLNFSLNWTKNYALYNSRINISYSVETSSSTWVVPSEVDLTLNGKEIEDETYNSGIIDITTYPDLLQFEANIDNVWFNFSLISFFSYEFELEAISHSYLKSILQTNTEKAIKLTKVEFLFSADIKHSYINNVDFNTQQEYDPDYLVIEDSSLKIEVILDDSVYLLLTDTENAYQINHSIRTDQDTISFRYFYEADKNFDNWYVKNEYKIVNYQAYFLSVKLDSFRDDDKFFIEQELEISDIVTFDYKIDPNFNVESTILENNGTYCKLKIDVESDLPVENVTIVVDDFDAYFESWINASQSEFTKKIEFNVSKLETQNVFHLEGFTSPPLVGFSSYKNSIEFIDAEFSEDLEYKGFLDIPQYSEIFYLPREPWALDGVHYSDRSYAITNFTFECEGFNENTLTAYLQFYYNPIIKFNETQLDDRVIISINTSLPIDCYLKFSVSDLQSYGFDNGEIEELYTINDVDYYYIQVQLDSGLNTFEFKFTEYDAKKVLTYLIPIIVVIAVLGIGFWYRNKKKKDEKSERDTAEVEKK